MNKKNFTLIIAIGFLWFGKANAQCDADFEEAFDPICIGQPETFINLSNPSNDATYTYTWNFGSGATPATFTGANPPTVTYSTAGNKTISLNLVKVAIGCNDWKWRSINVVAGVVASFTSNAPQCIGAAVNFTYTGTAAISFLWDFGVGSSPNTSTAQNPQGIVYSSSGTKTITLTVDNGFCKQIITQNITISATPIASFASTAPKCTGLAVDFTNTGTSSGATYSWNFGSGATPATSPSQNPTGVIYSTSGVKIVTLTITNSTTGCAVTATNTINIYQTPTSSFSTNAPVCANTAVNFTNNSTTGIGVVYNWDFGAGAVPSTSTAENPTGVIYNTGGDKIVTLTIFSGYCTDHATNTIYIYSLPIADAGADTTICANTSVQIGSNPISGYSYNWFPVSTLNNAQIANPTASPVANITNYIVLVTDNSIGCTNTDSVTITMLNPLIANAGIDVAICHYDSAQIGIGLIEGQIYAWTPETSLSNPFSPNPFTSPEQSTLYTLMVMSENGNCGPVYDDVLVTVYPLPNVYAGKDDTITVGSSIQLVATGAIEYIWMPPYGLSNPGISDPVASPEETITYVVLGKDIFGCENTDTITITVIEPSFWLPNAFTPDDDGKNDIFFVRGRGIEDFEFRIFNQLGENIFYSNDINVGWNGTCQINGQKVQQGAYVYLVRGVKSNGEPVNFSGLVNLIR